MAEITEVQEEQSKGKGAKWWSRLAMIFSSIWIATLSIFKGLGIMSMEMNDIIYSGFAITGIWSPTFCSIILDKIKDIKFGNSESSGGEK